FEYLFNRTALEAVSDTVHTPFTLRLASGTHVSLHEAALTDFPSATLVVPAGSSDVGADLVPWSSGIKAYVQAPFDTPWRTIRLAPDAKGLLHNFIDLNLNEPSRLGDPDWVKPGKYVGIWWAMHLGTHSWASGPEHGATTAETKRYIDFAAA